MELGELEKLCTFAVCLISSSGGIGRHAGLKILWAAMSVRVRFPSRAQKSRCKPAFLCSRRFAVFVRPPPNLPSGGGLVASLRGGTGARGISLFGRLFGQQWRQGSEWVWQDGDGYWLAPRGWVAMVSTGAGCFRNRSVIR